MLMPLLKTRFLIAVDDGPRAGGAGQSELGNYSGLLICCSRAEKSLGETFEALGSDHGGIHLRVACRNPPLSIVVLPRRR